MEYILVILLWGPSQPVMMVSRQTYPTEQVCHEAFNRLMATAPPHDKVFIQHLCISSVKT